MIVDEQVKNDQPDDCDWLFLPFYQLLLGSLEDQLNSEFSLFSLSGLYQKAS